LLKLVLCFTIFVKNAHLCLCVGLRDIWKPLAQGAISQESSNA
jgi:hypothetical protein